MDRYFKKEKVNTKYLDDLLEKTTLGFKFAYKKHGSHDNVFMLFNGKIFEYRYCTFCCNYIKCTTKYFRWYHRKDSFGRCCLDCNERSRLNSAEWRAKQRQKKDEENSLNA